MSMKTKCNDKIKLIFKLTKNKFSKCIGVFITVRLDFHSTATFPLEVSHKTFSCYCCGNQKSML